MEPAGQAFVAPVFQRILMHMHGDRMIRHVYRQDCCALSETERPESGRDPSDAPPSARIDI